MRSSIRGSKEHANQALKRINNSPHTRGPNALRLSSASLNPATASKVLTYLLMLACAICASYWLMRVIQMPGTPNQPSNGISKGLTLYSNQDATAAYGLFGSKPLATENIYLRGVVATSKNINGTLDGFAIFEIDGKPTNAISVGETIGKGLSLQSIGDEQATLLYQGQKLNFNLSKPIITR
jgi:hypothetical protein